MDTVPTIFVDAVIGLLSQSSLVSVAEMADPLWKNIGEEHAKNRIYFDMKIGVIDGNLAFSFLETTVISSSLELRRPVEPREIERISPRYWRIASVNGFVGSLRGFVSLAIQYNHLLLVEEDAFHKTLLQFSKQIEQPGRLLALKQPVSTASVARMRMRLPFIGTLNLKQEDLLTLSLMTIRAFRKRAYFNDVSIPYVGPESADFLRDHIYNHPHLSSIALNEDWPPSILEDLKQFLRKGLRRSVELPMTVRIDDEFVMELFEVWKRDGEFECTLAYELPHEAPQELLDLMTKFDEKTFHLKHENRKSAVIVIHQNALYRRCELRFVKCSCGVSNATCEWNASLHEL
ncbi:hypothetical protein QR680_014877 [Steinernema hermaphroditum]|uniref:Uncharacterized protein n=1 Tax=Steinernema hermaphroditum TaxID=289476 RepID=A0AA39IAF3_9BILA|nr:hypothetical protein QR680_014877 [Steinernema hermaphroditum]